MQSVVMRFDSLLSMSILKTVSVPLLCRCVCCCMMLVFLCVSDVFRYALIGLPSYANPMISMFGMHWMRFKALKKFWGGLDGYTTWPSPSVKKAPHHHHLEETSKI